MRADGYVQNPSSQMVAALVEAGADDVVIDLCAGPGGKATAMAGCARARRAPAAGQLDCRQRGPVRPRQRAGGHGRRTVPAGAPRPERSLLVDAPCSGLGVLGRRADARWRVEKGAVDDLAQLQRELLTAAAALVKPDGLLYTARAR